MIQDNWWIGFGNIGLCDTWEQRDITRNFTPASANYKYVYDHNERPETCFSGSWVITVIKLTYLGRKFP